MSVIAAREYGIAVFGKVLSDMSERFWNVEFVDFETFDIFHSKEQKQ